MHSKAELSLSTKIFNLNFRQSNVFADGNLAITKLKGVHND